jgi:hypothetical protein
MVFHLNYCKNNFRPLFCHILLNSAFFRHPIFPGHDQFFRASFELFGRKFGHLATVNGAIRHGAKQKRWTLNELEFYSVMALPVSHSDTQIRFGCKNKFLKFSPQGQKEKRISIRFQGILHALPV